MKYKLLKIVFQVKTSKCENIRKIQDVSTNCANCVHARCAQLIISFCTHHNYIKFESCSLEEEVNREFLLLSRSYVIRYNIDDFNKELGWEIIV